MTTEGLPLDDCVFTQEQETTFMAEAIPSPIRSCGLRSDRFPPMILRMGLAVSTGMFLLTTGSGCEDSRVVGVERGDLSAVSQRGVSTDRSRRTPAQNQRTVGRSRHFRFEQGARLKGLRSGSRIRVWMPVPPNNRDQTVREVHRDLPAKGTLSREAKYGNRLLYFETVVPSSGRLAFSVTYQVERQAIHFDRLSPPKRDLSEKERRLFLAPNAKVPIKGKPLKLLSGLRLPGSVMELARVLYDSVDASMRYDKSRPGYGRGDVLWACDSHFGNCTDFHSLFISLARSQKLPARFEIGFPLPEKRGRGSIGGYHCWAYFYEPNRGWVPVDISEADKHPDRRDAYFGQLTENRISLSTGRDLKLVPRQAGRLLNFFVYPYAEIDGKPLPPARMESHFAYADIASGK